MAETKKSEQETESSGSFTSDDSFDPAVTFAPPLQPTVEDAAGVERIVGTAADGWEPAPVEPDPEDVKRAEERERRMEEQKQARLDALKTPEVTETNTPKSTSKSSSSSKSGS